MAANVAIDIFQEWPVRATDPGLSDLVDHDPVVSGLHSAWLRRLTGG